MSPLVLAFDTGLGSAPSLCRELGFVHLFGKQASMRQQPSSELAHTRQGASLPTDNGGRPMRNRLLAALPAEEYAWIEQHLEPVTLHVRDVLAEPEKPFRYVYFPD